MDPTYVATYLEEERRRWWFLGRQAVLQSVLRVTLPPGRLRLAEIGCGGGPLICTVPAYQWLWSPHDEIQGHRRRYTARGLLRMVREAGLHSVRTTCFNTLLALAIILIRLLRRRRARASPTGTGLSHDLVRPAPNLNASLARIFALEAGLLRRPTLPFGISVLLVARRPPG